MENEKSSISLPKAEKGIAGWITTYFFPMLFGMEAVHALGVVHRDMKPENVLIDEDIPKITDFGQDSSKTFPPLRATSSAFSGLAGT